MGIFGRRAAIVAAGILLGWAVPVPADPAPQFPIVFTDMADLQALGLSLDWPPPMSDIQSGAAKPLNPPKFANTCYWYAGPHTQYILSLSDEFLAGYTAKGFSRESLCMALVSEARFDPETGARLPTYVYRDDRVLTAHLADLNPTKLTEERRGWLMPGTFANDADLEAAITRVGNGDLSGLTDEQASALIPDDHATVELPLKVPACFKNGAPLLDCNWKYGLKTGKKLSKQAPLRYREVGEALDIQINADIARGTGTRLYTHSHSSHETYLLMDRFVTAIHNFADDPNDSALFLVVSEPLMEWAGPVAWYAASPALPRGYGYALYAYAEGFGDGGVTVSSLLATFDGGRSSSKFNPARLKALLQ